MGSLFDALPVDAALDELAVGERYSTKHRSPPALAQNRDKRKAGRGVDDPPPPSDRGLTNDAAPLPPPPAELAWLSDLIGSDMTLRLVELRGGTRVFVPMRSGPNQWLARELSPAAEAALVREFPGRNFQVPLAKAWRAQVYRARGETVDAIARRLVTTDDTVATYLAWGRRRQRGALGF